LTILDQIVRAVPLNAEEKITPAAVSNIFEVLGDLDQMTILGVEMVGLKRTYEMQIH
jgi:hypothetical protein